MRLHTAVAQARAIVEIRTNTWLFAQPDLGIGFALKSQNDVRTNKQRRLS